MKEYEINLNEEAFNTLTKYGFINHRDEEEVVEIPIYKSDIKKLHDNFFLIKKVKNIYNIKLVGNIDKDLLTEIVKRSPLYSDLFI